MKGKYYFFAGLALIIGLRLIFVLLLPESQTVKYHLEGLGDEPAHFNYIKYLVKNHTFPIQTTTYKTPGASIRNDFEYFQPPVYYLIGTLGLRLGGGLYFCRMLSFFYGILSLWLIALIVKRMGASREVQAAGVLFCGLFPPHAYFCSVVSNDSLSWLVALALTYTFMGQGKESGCVVPDFTWRRSLLISFLLGAGSLVKSSLLLFYPIAAGCFLYSWFRRKNSLILLRLALTLVLAGLVNLPWLLRNYKIYHSFTGLSFLNGPEVPYPHLLTLQGFPLFLKTSIRYFWFPMQHIPISMYHKGLGMIGACILIALTVLAVRYIMKARPLSYGHLLLMGILCLVIAAYVKYNLVWGNREGRFLLPALASIVFFIVTPLHGTLKNVRREWLYFPAVFLMGAWGYSYLLLTF
jgi:4-amino-4-deoxy-L-arabinose transferase-like glycosyltransferase